MLTSGLGGREGGGDGGEKGGVERRWDGMDALTQRTRRSESGGAAVLQRSRGARARGLLLAHAGESHQQCLGERPTHAERLQEGGCAHLSVVAGGGRGGGWCEGRDDDV